MLHQNYCQKKILLVKCCELILCPIEKKCGTAPMHPSKKVQESEAGNLRHELMEEKGYYFTK